MTSGSPIVRIFDNEEGVGLAWKGKVGEVASKAGFDVQVIQPAEFQKIKKCLSDRQEEFRKSREIKYEGCVLDETTLLIVDYNLLGPQEWITGDTVAYLARCFSRCGLIIGLNKFGANPFDLTLAGDIDSYCDFHIGSDQLSNPGLWGSTEYDFRPWHWPYLPAFMRDYELRIEDVVKNPEASICGFLGLENLVDSMSPRTSSFLGEDPSSSEFADFIQVSQYGMSYKDRITVKKDSGANREAMSRIAAARLSAWLEQVVLPAQCLLVDAPHLVGRFPSLLGKDDLSRPETWNQTVNLKEEANLGIELKKIKKYGFPRSHWLSRSAWFWSGVSEDRGIDEAREPWVREPAKFGFCEDASKFREIEHCKPFIADVDSVYVRRFAARFEGVNYAPLARFMH